MGVLRMGYVHMRVTDMKEAKQHYTETMGLYPTLEADGKVYYKAWDEWDHHSLVLEEGGVGLAKMGWKVETPEDISAIEKKAQDFGCVVERMSKGDNPEVSDGIRIILPSTHVLEVYHDMTRPGVEVGVHNPDSWPRHMKGIGAPRLDHALISTDDAKLLEKFFMDVMDLYPMERLQTSLDDDAHMIASWLTCGNTVHDIAVIEGPQGKIHHFAYEMRGWDDILKSADIFSMDDVPIDIGPTRHGITRGETIYFFDPSGNRVETFTGGYIAMRDRPMVTWTADQVGKAIFYHSRTLNEAFTSVFT